MKRYSCLMIIIALFYFLCNAETKGLFFSVEKDGVKSYIMGSVHLGRPDFFPLSSEIERAFEQTRILAVEADILDSQKSALAAVMIQQSAFYPQGENIKSHLSLQNYNILKKRLDEVGVNIEVVENYKPWYISFILIPEYQMYKMNFDSSYGVDSYFLRKAKDKRKIVELEGLDAQIKLLSGFSDNDMEEYIEDMVTTISQSKNEIEQTVKYWSSGDVKGLEKIVLPDYNKRDREVFKKIFTERNINMSYKIAELLNNKENAFIVVGAAHLIGDKSVIDLLTKEGYIIRQIK